MQKSQPKEEKSECLEEFNYQMVKIHKFKHVILMKEVWNLNIYFRRFKECVKKRLWIKSLLIDDRFQERPHVKLSSIKIKPLYKHVKNLDLKSSIASTNHLFSKFSGLRKFKITFTDSWQIFFEASNFNYPYKQLARSFSLNIFKKLNTLDILIEDRTNFPQVEAFLKSIPKCRTIENLIIDFGGYNTFYAEKTSLFNSIFSNIRNISFIKLDNSLLSQLAFSNQRAINNLMNHLQFINMSLVGEYGAPIKNFIDNLKKAIHFKGISLNLMTPTCDEVFSHINPLILSQQNITDLSLGIDSSKPQIQRKNWEEFYQNVSLLKNLQRLKLRLISFPPPFLKMLAQATRILEHLKTLSLSISNISPYSLNDTYDLIGEALNPLKELEDLTLVMSTQPTTLFHKIFEKADLSSLISLKLLIHLDIKKNEELEALLSLVNRNIKLKRIYLDVNYSKMLEINVMFPFHWGQRLMEAAFNKKDLESLHLHLSGFEDGFTDLFKSVSSFPEKLGVFSLQTFHKKLTDRELSHLTSLINKAKFLESFSIKADFGTITEAAFTAFCDFILNSKKIHYLSIDPKNSIVQSIHKYF
jgi:hypothetical protein